LILEVSFFSFDVLTVNPIADQLPQQLKLRSYFGGPGMFGNSFKVCEFYDFLKELKVNLNKQHLLKHMSSYLHPTPNPTPNRNQFLISKKLF
jgi:hypothetical protein